MHTLRFRLVLSHVLPLLLVVSLIGVSLDYVLETRILLTNLAGELTGEAVLVAGLVTDSPELWTDADQAQAFLQQLDPNLAAKAMLIDLDGRLLASTDTADNDLLGQRMSSPGLAAALAGEVQVHTEYSWYQQAEVVEVLVPAWSRDHQIVGVIRLSQQLANVVEQFLNLRYLIAGVSAAALLLGVAIASLLALNLGRPLQRVTGSVQRLASRQRSEPLRERGPIELRQLSRAVNSLVERLHELEHTRERLLANLVHELARPLGAILAAVQALQDGAVQDKALSREILDGIKQEIGRLRRLLDDLSRLYDRALGSLEIEPRPVDMREWLAAQLLFWKQTAEAKGLGWQTELPDNLPRLTFDPDRLAQAVSNLLSNAIKFTPPGGTVSVSAGVRPSEVWIRVSDTGIGIPAEERAQLFEPFFRGRAASRFPQGMGLGLGISRDLVQAHGGRLEVQSVLGQGSQFTIIIPITGSTRQPATFSL